MKSKLVDALWVVGLAVAVLVLAAAAAIALVMTGPVG
mgnify:CR=1 FL=1